MLGGTWSGTKALQMAEQESRDSEGRSVETVSPSDSPSEGSSSVLTEQKQSKSGRRP